MSVYRILVARYAESNADLTSELTALNVNDAWNQVTSFAAQYLPPGLVSVVHAMWLTRTPDDLSCLDLVDASLRHVMGLVSLRHERLCPETRARRRRAMSTQIATTTGSHVAGGCRAC
jgi:hypothetical protein